eukprot:scaffold12826_cov17-Tisochrysis_lutea.AAC.1
MACLATSRATKRAREVTRRWRSGSSRWRRRRPAAAAAGGATSGITCRQRCRRTSPLRASASPRRSSGSNRGAPH